MVILAIFINNSFNFDRAVTNVSVEIPHPTGEFGGLSFSAFARSISLYLFPGMVGSGDCAGYM